MAASGVELCAFVREAAGDRLTVTWRAEHHIGYTRDELILPQTIIDFIKCDNMGIARWLLVS